MQRKTDGKKKAGGAGLDRREFCGSLARAALAGAVGSALGPLGFGGAREARAAGAPALAAVKGAPAAAARRAVELLGGMGKFVKAGQRVVVKPNIGWDRTPEQAANTHPEVVAAVVRMCLEAGAADVLVFDRTCNDQRLCYRHSGVEDAVNAVGDKRARIVQPDERRYVPVAIPRGKAFTTYDFYEDAARAEVFVNVPIAKDHGLTRLTMSMKNLMGVAGGNRGRIHSDFEDKIVDLNLGRPSHLVVLDATRVLLRNGPQGGRLEDVARPGVVVAGTNVVAVDAYGTRFFGLEPKDVRHLVRAAERGLGPIDLSGLEVREESL